MHYYDPITSIRSFLKNVPRYTFSLTGLLLVAVSAIAAGILPKTSPELFNGVLANSTGGTGNQKTCINVAGSKNCHYTAATETSHTGEFTSKPDSGSSQIGVGSSQSPS
jgi:hypothetical protein